MANPSAEEKPGNQPDGQPADMCLPGNPGDKGPENKKDKHHDPERHGKNKIKTNRQFGHHHHQSAGNGIDSAGGADNQGQRLAQPQVESIAGDTTNEVKQEKPAVAYQPGKKRAEEIEGKHIAEDVPESIVQEHAGEYRPGSFRENIRD